MQFRNFLTTGCSSLLWNRYGDGDITRLHQDVVLTSVSVISSLDTEGTWRREIKARQPTHPVPPRVYQAGDPVCLILFYLFKLTSFLFCFGYNKHEFLKSCDHHCIK